MRNFDLISLSPHALKRPFNRRVLQSTLDHLAAQLSAYWRTVGPDVRFFAILFLCLRLRPCCQRRLSSQTVPMALAWTPFRGFLPAYQKRKRPTSESAKPTEDRDLRSRNAHLIRRLSATGLPRLSTMSNVTLVPSGSPLRPDLWIGAAIILVEFPPSSRCPPATAERLEPDHS
jgi:hypothetical protein